MFFVESMLNCFVGRVSTALFFVTLTGSNATCPIKIDSPKLVVQYGESASADCTASVPFENLGWEASAGERLKQETNRITWSLSKLTEWEMSPPICYINYKDQQCERSLSITLYKTPDSVSITINTNLPLVEGRQFELQCDVHNVAPARLVTVKWYKRETLLNQTNFTDSSKTPVDKTAKILVTGNKHDDGAWFRCEAEMNLGAEGPLSPPKVISKPLRVDIYYPVQHSSSLEIINQCIDVILNCTVRSNPTPEYKWSSEHLKEDIRSSELQASSLTPGNYTCTATNRWGEDSKVFIVSCTGRTTFWALVIAGVGVAVVLIAGYVVYKIRSPSNSVI